MGKFGKFNSWIIIIALLLITLISKIQLDNYEEIVTDQHLVIDELMNEIQETSTYLREANFTIQDLNNRVDMLSYENKKMEKMIEELKTIPAVITNYAPLDPNAVEGMDYSGNPSITATGTTVRRGVAAADPRRLPYGTKLYIPSFGEVVIEDTGSAMRNNDRIQIDVFVESRSKAFQYGIQHEEVKIILD